MQVQRSISLPAELAEAVTEYSWLSRQRSFSAVVQQALSAWPPLRPLLTAEPMPVEARDAD